MDLLLLVFGADWTTMRSRETSYGLDANGFAIGSITLNTNIDIKAGAQWAQTQFGYAFSNNRNYRHRFTFSHGSGFNKRMGL